MVEIPTFKIEETTFNALHAITEKNLDNNPSEVISNVDELKAGKDGEKELEFVVNPLIPSNTQLINLVCVDNTQLYTSCEYKITKTLDVKSCTDNYCGKFENIAYWCEAYKKIYCPNTEYEKTELISFKRTINYFSSIFSEARDISTVAKLKDLLCSDYEEITSKKKLALLNLTLWLNISSQKVSSEQKASEFINAPEQEIVKELKDLTIAQIIVKIEKILSEKCVKEETMAPYIQLVEFILNIKELPLPEPVPAL